MEAATVAASFYDRCFGEATVPAFKRGERLGAPLSVDINCPDTRSRSRRYGETVAFVPRKPLGELVGIRRAGGYPFANRSLCIRPDVDRENRPAGRSMCKRAPQQLSAVFVRRALIKCWSVGIMRRVSKRNNTGLGRARQRAEAILFGHGSPPAALRAWLAAGLALAAE